MKGMLTLAAKTVRLGRYISRGDVLFVLTVVVSAAYTQLALEGFISTCPRTVTAPAGRLCVARASQLSKFPGWVQGLASTFPGQSQSGSAPFHLLDQGMTMRTRKDLTV